MALWGSIFILSVTAASNFLSSKVKELTHSTQDLETQLGCLSFFLLLHEYRFYTEAINKPRCCWCVRRPVLQFNWLERHWLFLANSCTKICFCQRNPVTRSVLKSHRERKCWIRRHFLALLLFQTEPCSVATALSPCHPSLSRWRSACVGWFQQWRKITLSCHLGSISNIKQHCCFQKHLEI